MAATHFDWVTERARCSLTVVFEQLRVDVESDLNKRNAMRGNDIWYDFALVNLVPAQNNFMVVMNAHGNKRTVRFTKTDKSITIHKEGSIEPNIEATLTLNDDGECRLKVNGKEYELWQVRRMAIETLLFDYAAPTV